MILPSALPSTIPYHLMEQVRALIIDGTYGPGEPLREQDLERRFSSSRSPIREALRLLEIKGLVVHVPRKGFRVRRMTAKEISDLYDLRAELESYSIQRLEELSDLKGLLDAMNIANNAMGEAYRTHDIHGYLAANATFHHAIVDALENHPLRLALAQITEIAQPLRFNVLSKELVASTSLDFHRRITAALAGQDFPQAGELMREHILVSLPGVLRCYPGSEEAADSEPLPTLARTP